MKWVQGSRVDEGQYQSQQQNKEEPKKDLSLSELERMYEESTQADESIYSEMRSNILLVSGDHYSNKKSKLYQSMREPTDSSQRQRLRIVKNHIHKISRIYQENIASYTPGVEVAPQIATERQDQKAAQIAQSVWEHIKRVIKFPELRETLIQSYVDIGEVAVKGFWDETKGAFKGFKQKLDESDQPMVDAMGKAIADEAQPVFEGEICFEEVYGFNLFRPIEAASWDEAEWIGVRKMVSIETLKARYGADDERVQKLGEDKEEFVIFDVSKNAYQKTKGQTVWKEIFHRPCPKYPNGYYQMWTRTGIFHEGELPFGIFPLVVRPFEKYPTLPRGKSVPIKIARPYQAEINRAGSSQAMAQLTLGDDKILYQAGTKVAPGKMLPGVRGMTYQGQPPIVLPGRDGGQFTDYIMKQIAEMYTAVMLEEENQENQDSVADPIALLLRSLRKRKKFAKYATGIERFFVNMCELGLELGRNYYDDERMVLAIGPDERVNLSEFKNITPLQYKISLEPVDDTVETKLGKHLTLTQALQYVGKQLKAEDIGRILKQMPFVDLKDTFSDLTIDQENADNIMLALERGEKVGASDYDNHDYILRRLTKRVREASFRYLAPEVQSGYQEQITFHESALADQQRKLLAAKDEYIPTEGPLVKADVYIGDPSNPDKMPKRAQIPQRALEWLIKRLDDQGNSLDRLETMNQRSLVEMADMIKNKSGVPQGQPGMPTPPAGQMAPQVQGGMQ